MRYRKGAKRAKGANLAMGRNVAALVMWANFPAMADMALLAPLAHFDVQRRLIP